MKTKLNPFQELYQKLNIYLRDDINYWKDFYNRDFIRIYKEDFNKEKNPNYSLFKEKFIELFTEAPLLEIQKQNNNNTPPSPEPKIKKEDIIKSVVNTPISNPTPPPPTPTSNKVGLLKKVEQASQYSKDKSKSHGEVFTPFELIDEILDKFEAIEPDFFKDKSKKVLDPCAGKGNFPVKLLERFNKGLKAEIPNQKERLQYILKNIIYMVELQKESCDFIRNDLFQGYEINLYEGDYLKMPENYFDIKE